GLMCAVCLLTLGGCAAVLVGAGVAGGMAISKDTAKLETDKSAAQGWAASSKVIKQMGIVTVENQKKGKIETNVRDAKINIMIVEITPKTIRVEVKARKDMLPQMDLANEILNKIHDQLNSLWN